MITETKGTVAGAAFHNAPSESDFQLVYKNNMDENSNMGLSKLIEHVLLHPQTAFFGDEQNFDVRETYQNCQVLMSLNTSLLGSAIMCLIFLSQKLLGSFVP